MVMVVTLKGLASSKQDADWKIGRIVEVMSRKVKIGKTVLERNPCDVSVLVSDDKLAINSTDYLSNLMTLEKNPDLKLVPR